MRATAATPYDDDFYAWLSQSSLPSARVIVPLLLSRIQPRSVVDIGCGTGAWLKAFQESGVADVLGCDGDYLDDAKLLIDPSCFRAVDLRNGFRLDRTFDLGVSLEVAEHLPASVAGGFIRQLTATAPAILFSAAIPGQGGVDHVNEQWQDYWRELFDAEGFQPVDLIRPSVRGLKGVEIWFQQNTVLYCSGGFLTANPGLDPVSRDLSLNQVHPTLYEKARAPRLGNIVRMTARLAHRTLTFPGGSGQGRPGPN